MRTSFRFAIAVAALLLLPASQAASVSVYTNRSDWVTATPNAITISFEGLAPGFGSIFLPTPPGTTLSNVNFNIDHTANNGSLYVYGPGFPYAGNSALSTQGADSGTNNILVTLPAGTTSVGLDFGNLAASPGKQVRFRLNTGESFTGITSGYDGPSGPRWFSFIGLSSDQSIQSLLIEYSEGTAINIDNFSYALAADTNAPTLSGQGANITIQCPAVPVFTAPTATDDRDANPTITFTNVTIAGTCSGSFATTRTWVAVDQAGNTSAPVSQTITVQDTTPPIILGLVLDKTVLCDHVPSPLVRTAVDNCDTNPSVVFSEIKTAGNCPGNYILTRTWIAQDACGNSATNRQVLTVEDMIPPVLAGQGTNRSISCPATPVFTAPNATDNCDTNPLIVFADVLTPGTGTTLYTVRRTWTAIDHCSNVSASVNQTITVQDLTAPDITCPTNMTVEFKDLSGAVVQFSAGAAEGCGSNVVAVCVPASGSTFPIGTTTVHCNATDSSGNSTSCDFTVTVLGARAAKLKILDELVTYRAGEAGGLDQKQLDKAIGALVSATNASVWVDQNHLVSKSGGRVFDLEKAAAQKLKSIVSNPRSPVPDELLLDWIARLVNVDRLLAQISVEEAASIGAPPKKIAECRQLIAKGDADAAAGRPTVAIGRYRTAWKRAVDLEANPGP